MHDMPLLFNQRWQKDGQDRKGSDLARWLARVPTLFYQYWYNTANADVLLCLRFLTEIDQDEYRSLEKSLAEDPGARLSQKRLASWLTEFIHGAEGLQAALAEAAAVLC
ncbi:MAG: hypothetical protein U0930_26000 [Pirellulales bacterium]